MIGFLLTIWGFVRIAAKGFADPRFRGLFYSVLILLIIGMIFYNQAEGWSLLDSFFFSVTTLTTIGYGNLYPTTVLSKVFTIIYVLLGLGLLAGFVNAMGTHVLSGRHKGPERKD